MVKRQLSRYIRLYYFDNKCILYNTKNCVCVIVPKKLIEGERSLATDDVTKIHFLESHSFFIDRVEKNDCDRYFSQDTLFVSIETSLSCNFSCPYCYQTNNQYGKNIITSESLNLLFSYIKRVHKKTNLRVLYLKILGGEPSISWIKIVPFLSVIYGYCKNNHIRMNLKVDTNGFYVEPFTKYNLYDTIHFTIPLCHKSIHNRYRQSKNREDTYDIIVSNINKLSLMRDSSFVIRHNTDACNIQLFDNYLSDIREKLRFNPNINPQYTTNPLLGKYNNQLSRADYIHWLSTSCIDSLIKRKFGVYVSPLRLGACSYNSTYSIKLFSSGKVGACARFFYDNDNPFLSEILEKDNLTKDGSWWKGAKEFSPFKISKCLNCPSLFTCGGHYFLPCIKDYDLPKCNPEKTLYIDYEEYFMRLHKYYELGKVSQFKNIHFYDLFDECDS